MASTLESFQNLNLSRDEVERIGEALKDKEFRKLLTEYIEEIRDPENRKLYEEEVTQLEKERGMDVKFINPIAGYVIKTSVNGAQKAFVNVASNEHIGCPTSTPTFQEGHKGLQWSLPHTLSPPRDEYDSKRVRCMVYDVVFHPDTLRLAKNNKQFKNLVNSTACDSIEKNFGVTLDQKNLKFPNVSYKGVDHPSIIRTPSKTTPSPKSEEEQKFLDDIFSRLPPPNANSSFPKQESTSKNSKSSKTVTVEDPRSKYTTPKYIIKHRTHVDMQEYTYDMDAKENVAIPKELIVEVFLPMLRSSEGVVLDVTEKTIKMISEIPAKYKLNITLPYAVNQELGNAKFEKDCKKLVIILPVIRNKHFLITDVNSIDDSGVESDHGSPTLNCTLIEELKEQSKQLNDNLIAKLSAQEENYDFFDSSTDYTLPEHICQLENNNVLHFTFKVKNVNSSSIKQLLIGDTTLLIKFISISTGFFPINYGIILQINDGSLDDGNVEIEVWDNNVIAQISVVHTNAIKSYTYGSTRGHLIESCLDDKSQTTANIEEKKVKISVKHDPKTNQCEDNSLGTGFSENVSNTGDYKAESHNNDADLSVLIDNNLIANKIKMGSQELKKANSLNNLILVVNDNKNSKCNNENVNISKSDNSIEEEKSEKPVNSAKTENSKSDNVQEIFKKPTNSKNTLECLKANVNINFSNVSDCSMFELKQTQAVDINHSIKENIRKFSFQSSASPSSSCDEHSGSCGYSCSSLTNLNTCKGILKQRMRATRSISESGLDDALCCIGGSLEMDSCSHSVEEEGVIEEEEEDEDVTLAASVGSTKKTVRFSENISQQLFRSNSSILGQKKKNQRKSRNKKRAQERRHSESEICDNNSGYVADNHGNTGDKKTEQNREIIENGKDTQFDLDM